MGVWRIRVKTTMNDLLSMFSIVDMELTLHCAWPQLMPNLTLRSRYSLSPYFTDEVVESERN